MRIVFDASLFASAVALYMEWQAVLSRPEHLPRGQSAQTARGFLRYLASMAHLQEVHYLWRPFLRDPADDMVLELAIATQARYVVTHNLRDFDRTTSMGVIALSPGDFYQRIQSGDFS